MTDVRPATDELSLRAAQLIAAGRALDARGLVPATSGNLSARLSDGRFAVTASGPHKGRLTADDVLAVDGEGRSADGRRASAETGLHLQLYRRLPDVHAVLHPHAPAATVLSRLSGDRVVLEGYELLKALPGIETHDVEVVVPVFDNDQEIPRLAARVEAWMDDHGPPLGYLIRSHGLYTWGANVEAALRHVEAFEFLFECELRLRGVDRP